MWKYHFIKRNESRNVKLLCHNWPLPCVCPLVPPKGEGWEWGTGRGEGNIPPAFSPEWLTTVFPLHAGVSKVKVASLGGGGRGRPVTRTALANSRAESESSVRASHWHCYKSHKSAAAACLVCLALKFQCCHVTSGHRQRKLLKCFRHFINRSPLEAVKPDKGSTGMLVLCSLYI